MNVIKLPSKDNPGVTANPIDVRRTNNVPVFSPRRAAPRHQPIDRNSPSPQKFENINNALVNTYASIDVKYVDPETNRVLFLKITNEFGQQLIAMISFNLTNVEPSINDVMVEARTQRSYPEKLAEYIKTAGQKGFGLANETVDGMTIVMNTDVEHFAFPCPNPDNYRRDKQYIVADINNIVHNLQAFNQETYSVIHGLTNITQSRLFDRIDQYVDNLRLAQNHLSTIYNISTHSISDLIGKIQQTTRDKIQENNHGNPALMQYKIMLSSKYTTIHQILDSLSELDHLLNKETILTNIEDCRSNLATICPDSFS